MTNNDPKPAAARVYGRTPYVSRERRHKFAVGEIVGLISRSGELRPKREEQELLTARFEVVRLLPEQDRSFQYRVKDAVTGQERVVAEEGLVTKA